MPLPLTHNRRPAFAEQDQRTWTNHARLNLIPNKRQLSDGPHPAADRNETNRPRNQPLKPFIKMWSGNFVGEIAIRFSLKLIHDDAQNPSAALVCAPARGFHHT